MKWNVNTRFEFDLNKDVNWDIVEIKERQFHIVYNEKSFVARPTNYRP